MTINENNIASSDNSETLHLYKNLFETASIGIIILSKSGVFLNANQMFLNLLGYNEAQLKNMSFVEVVRPNSKGVFENLFEKKEATSNKELLEVTTKSGELKWINISIFPIKSNELVAATIEDITKEKEKQIILNEAHENLTNLFTSIKEGIIILGNDGKIFHANPAALSILDLSKDQLFGIEPKDPKWKIIGEDGTIFSELEHAGRISLRTGKPQYHIKMGIIKSDDKTTWISMNSTILKNKYGEEYNEVLLSFDDITDYKEIQMNLIESREAERKANIAKSEFLSNISHEIRTPLNGILGSSDLLLDTPLNSEQIELTNVIKNSGLSLLELINDILDLSKIEAGKFEIAPISANLNEIIKEVLKPHAINAKTKGVKLTHEIDAFPYKILADAQRITQILNNLLSNAIKFTPEGRVTLSVRLMNESPTHCRVCFRVIDNGIGIPKDSQNRLFKVFSQANKAISRDYGGTGLGLSIVKTIVDLMNGSIRVMSEEGRGSMFEVVVVFKKEESHASLIATPSPQAIHGNRINGRILVAEDNVINQNLILKMLQRLGCTTALATNGKEAVDMAMQEDFDLILMDCRMPVMSGMEATTTIRSFSEQKKKNIKIVALTANASEEDKKMCIDCGMNDFISKPVNKEKLFSILANYLQTEEAQTKQNKSDKPSLIDLGVLADLEDLNKNEPGFLAKQIDLFCESAKRLLAKLTISLSAGNLEAVKEIAHSIKSVSAGMGSVRIPPLAKEIEEKISTESKDVIRKICKNIKSETEEFCTYLLQTKK